MNKPTRSPSDERVDALLRSDAARIRADWAGSEPRRRRTVLARLGAVGGAAGLAAAVVGAVLLWPASDTTPPKPATPDPAVLAEWSGLADRLAAARIEAARQLDEAGRWPQRVTTLDRPLVALGDEAAAAAAAEFDALAADARQTVRTATGPLADLHRAITRAERG